MEPMQITALLPEAGKRHEALRGATGPVVFFFSPSQELQNRAQGFQLIL